MTPKCSRENCRSDHRSVFCRPTTLSNPATPVQQQASTLPPIVARALSEPPCPQMPWYRGIAPAYLTLFIWAPFFDELWAGGLSRSGLAWLFGSAVLGSAICFGMYFMAATWGFAARRPLVAVASSTFGAAGSEWLCGLAISFAAFLWYAIAVNFAVDTTFLGLRACGLLKPEGLAPLSVGSVELKSPVFLCTSLFWVYITRQAIYIKMKLAGVVVGLMKVYSPIAVLLLAASALWRAPVFWSQSAGSVSGTLLERAPVVPASHHGALVIMTGFFAVGALLSVDWGAAVRNRGDIIRAGAPFVLGAAAFSSIFSLLCVLETANGLTAGAAPLAAGRIDPAPFSFRWAIFQGRESFPPGVAAAILILFGLAALAAAVSSLNKLCDGVSTHWPRITPRGASAIAGLLALCVMATGLVDRVAPFFIAIGCFFAPVLGAMAGDLTRGDVQARPFRAGINASGVLAWGVGCAVAFGLAWLPTITGNHIPWLEQGPIVGFLVSACVFRLLARSGADAAPMAVEK